MHASKNSHVLVEGAFDFTHYGHFTFLRFLRLLFPRSRTQVNVLSDEVSKQRNHGHRSYVEERHRCEVMSACRWSDSTSVSKCGLSRRPSIRDLRASGVDYYVTEPDYFSSSSSVSSPVIRSSVRSELGQTFLLSTQELLSRFQGTSNSGDVITLKTLSSFPPRSRQSSVPDAINSFILLSFDYLSSSTIQLLKSVRMGLCPEDGDSLFVGIEKPEDDTSSNPLFSLTERLYSLLSLKYVDDVVILPSGGRSSRRGRGKMRQMMRMYCLEEIDENDDEVEEELEKWNRSALIQRLGLGSK